VQNVITKLEDRTSRNHRAISREYWTGTSIVCCVMLLRQRQILRCIEFLHQHGVPPSPIVGKEA
jgi:hypothetical protein